MEGLEISIKTFSRLRDNNPTNRLDSEFYKKEYLSLFKILEPLNCDKLDNLSKWITQGPNPKFIEDGIPCLTGRNINKGRVSYLNADYVSQSEYESLKRFQLNTGDTLITLKGKGSIGKIGYVTEETKAVFSRDIGIIRPNKIDSGYVNAYILSKFGTTLIERGETGGTGQSTLATSYLKNIDIPRFNIEDKIGKLVISSESVLKQSKQTYQQAEEILLDEIGLEDFKPSNDAVNIKSFADSFQTSGRLDAEYYQKKYDDYINLIKSYKEGWEEIDTACNNKGKNFNPDTKKEYKYVELSNIGKSGDINGCTIDAGEELPSRARRKINTGDIIVSSIEGSLDSCALVTSEYDNSLCSTGFYVLDSDKVNSETLLVLFKSEPMQAILKQNCSGTILTAINKGEFLNIPLPLIDNNKQKQIASLIETSFSLKAKSEKLLEVAKAAVEIAIEQNEAEALKYIEGSS